MVFRASWVSSPNLVQKLANSPAALTAYLGFAAALGEGKLTGRQREQIAVAVANTNECDYCLSAHNHPVSTGAVRPCRMNQHYRCSLF